MSKDTLEQISSLIDGELSRETSLFLTRRLGSDTTLSGVWERYHLIRDCLRQPGGKMAVRRIQCELGELDGRGEDTAGPARWLKPVSGVAIAASVAVLAIVMAVPQSTSRQATPAAKSFVSPNTMESIPISQPASLDAANSIGTERLNSYLLRHNQMAGIAGRQGFVSFVPMVTASGENQQDEPKQDPRPELTPVNATKVNGNAHQP